MTAIWYITGAAVCACVLWLGAGVRRIGAVSNGARIGDRANTALLMIDLQTVFWDNGPYSDAAKATAQSAILDEIAHARAQGHPVIALRQ